MYGSQDDIPPPPPSQTPTQQTPHTVLTIKLPILKKGEYDIWAMKMEHYLAHTDYPIWEVIQNRNGPVLITTDTQGQIKVLAPRTAEEILAREKERKARTTLFGGNDESKKMQKYILKQQFEGFSVSNLKGLHKGYDRFQSLLIQLEIHGRKLQFDAKEPVGFDKTKRLVLQVVTRQGILLESAEQREIKIVRGEMLGTLEIRMGEDLASTTEVISCSKECKESYVELKKLYDKQRAQLSDASIEILSYTQALKKVEAQLVAHQQGQLWYEEKIRFMKIDLDDKTDVLTYHKKLLAEAEKEKEDLKAKMSANDKFGLGYGDHRYDGILSYENEVLQSVFMNKESDLENQPLYDSDFDTRESDCSVETHESLPEPAVNKPKVVNQPKVWSEAPIIKEYESDSEDEHVSLPTEKQETPSFANQQSKKLPRETVKNQFTHSKNPNVDKKGLGYGFTTKACFVCGSLSHLIRDCDFHKKMMAKQVELKGKGYSQREIRPVWNNVQKVNHKNQFVTTVVLTRIGKIPVSTARTSGTNIVNTARASGTNNVSTARHNFISQAILTNAARKISNVKPFVNREVKVTSLICEQQEQVLFTDSEFLFLSPEFKKKNQANNHAVPTRTIKMQSSKASEEPTKHLDIQQVDKENQVFLDELERLKIQEQDANNAAEALRKEFAQETR
ncbi:hypothetical protein Tco_1262693 [Tanacetum coccineum]